MWTKLQLKPRIRHNVLQFTIEELIITFSVKRTEKKNVSTRELWWLLGRYYSLEAKAKAPHTTIPQNNMSALFEAIWHTFLLWIETILLFSCSFLDSETETESSVGPTWQPHYSSLTSARNMKNGSSWNFCIYEVYRCKKKGNEINQFQFLSFGFGYYLTVVAPNFEHSGAFWSETSLGTLWFQWRYGLK